MTESVVFKNVSIIFGDNPQKALAMVDAGKSRDEIGAETGLVLGVADATLSITEGEILVLMGLSGSGKSTLLRAVNGLAPVVRGEVGVKAGSGSVNPYAATPKALRDFRMHTVSMVFQQFALLPWRTVADNVGFGLELAGVPDGERKARVAEQLELVNLAQWAGRRVNELSGGMQQRVGLAPVVRGGVQVKAGGGGVNPYAATPKALRDFRMHTVSMVFQQFALLPWRTVADNVGFGLELAGVPESERKARVAEQLELVNLSKWAGRKVNELSGGMQQRVGLARAFATGAPILLMDEPFSALDPLIRTRLQDELLEFQRRLKKTIIFVSHDLDEAFRIGNRIAIMEGGRIIQCGTPQEIVKNPANQYVADFVQNMNPITMLTAGDVMRHGAAGEAGVTATAARETPLVDILDAMARAPGSVGVVDNGAVIGTISAQDIVNGLTRHRRRG